MSDAVKEAPAAGTFKPKKSVALSGVTAGTFRDSKVTPHGT